MHALQLPILLRMPRLDALRHDAQLHPPHRQPRQPGKGPRGERRPVVGADRQRHAVLAKRRFEDRLHPRRVRLLHRLHPQQVAAVGIRDGQRIDAGAVAGAKPALEVGAPDAVGLRRLPPAAGCTAGCDAACGDAASALRGPAAPRWCWPPATHTAAASCCSRCRSVRGPQRGCCRRSASTWLFDLRRRLIGMPLRRPAALFQRQLARSLPAPQQLHSPSAARCHAPGTSRSSSSRPKDTRPQTVCVVPPLRSLSKACLVLHAFVNGPGCKVCARSDL